MAAQTPIPILKLNDGHSIPLIGYGTGTTWFNRGDTGLNYELIETTKTAIKLGYRHLDGAEGPLPTISSLGCMLIRRGNRPVYGTEQELGIAIKESRVPRAEFFVTTKVWGGMSDIPKAFEASLGNLGLDYVDLYLIHAPFSAKSEADLQSAWAELENLQAAGKVRSIGVSNFLPQHLTAILKTAKIKPAINQIEFHPYLQNAELQQFQKEHGIALAAYGSMAPLIKAKPGPVDEVIRRLSAKYGVGEGEVLLRWVMEQGIVAITTSRKEPRLRGYLKAAEFSLTPEEVEEISVEGEKKHFRGFWKNRFQS